MRGESFEQSHTYLVQVAGMEMLNGTGSSIFPISLRVAPNKVAMSFHTSGVLVAI